MNETFEKQLADMVIRRMAEVGYKHDLPAGFTLTTNLMHGPTGIFGFPGIEREVMSTRVTPEGLLNALPPAVPTVYTEPVAGFLTGFTDQSGDEATYPCDECVETGQIKSCLQYYPLGRICRQTQPIEMDEVGKRVNRGEMDDLMIVNDPLMPPTQGVPRVNMSLQDILNREILARLMLLGSAFQDTMCQLIWTGNPSNNTSGGYAEFLGLENLVKTGHTDMATGVSCPSLDSDIKDANNMTIENNMIQIYFLLQELWRYVNYNRKKMQFGVVDYRFVMKEGMFRALCDRWPCVYASSRCNATANDVTASVDGMRMKAMSDEMYTGQYLLIDSVRVPVVIDDCIPYESSDDGFDLDPGAIRSDIYLLPFSVRGGAVPVLYMEYVDYRATNGVLQGLRDGNIMDQFWTDNGMFLFTYNRTNWCVSWKAKLEPRLRLKTPHLAGRLENVIYNPIQHVREPLPDQHYFVDGGKTYRDNSIAGNYPR